MGRRKNKKKSHWSAYNPTDASADAAEGGVPGGPAFFHYHPGSSGINQSWWFNTFGKQQDPPLEGEENPATSTSSEIKNEVRNEFPLEPKSYDPRYREYRPSPRSLSPVSRPRPPRSRTATPPPPQGPSPGYLATSDGPSNLLADPTSSRKLLVLDLNGTLLHRSPHPSKNAPRYSIPGQEGFQPRLRSVHPRPYLQSFKSYIFHPANKGWLDVMVWSSAQPHSVHDMVDKCFRDEKHHFVAVWARDTLGLPQHLYSRKVQTLKDLNIPWSKLFTPDHPGTESHHTSRHTAMSTLLMDDSPRKAEAQPYNHLCVKEYSNVIRNRDLASLLEEKAQVKSPSLPPPTEESESHPLPSPPQLPLRIPHPLSFNLPPPPIEPPSDFQFDQSVGIQPGATLLNPLPFATGAGSYSGDSGIGRGVIAPQMLFKNPSPSMVGYQNPRTLQRPPQSKNPFPPPQQTHHSQSHPHSPLTEAPGQLITLTQGDSLPLVETTTEETKPPSSPLLPASTSKKRKRNGKREAECEASRAELIHEPKYDETLLAIVGILSEVKHQSNVASWVKGNGLWGPHLPQNPADPNTDTPTDKSSYDDRGDVATLSDNGSMESGRYGEGKKKRKDGATAFFEVGAIEGSEDGGLLLASTNEQRDHLNTSEVPLWFDNPSTMQHWVDQGRNALDALGIPIEHGLKV